MIAGKTFIRGVRVAALFSVLVAVPAAAQTANPQADALSSQATELYGTPPRFREAAELHLKAAELRSVDDPRRVSDLMAAGRLFVYSGDVAQGRRSIEKAAQTALVIGDLADAGHMYIDAAFVAAQAQDVAGARQMLRAARWIASAPMLRPDEEQRLLRRMTADEDSN